MKPPRRRISRTRRDGEKVEGTHNRTRTRENSEKAEDTNNKTSTERGKVEDQHSIVMAANSFMLNNKSSRTLPQSKSHPSSVSRTPPGGDHTQLLSLEVLCHILAYLPVSDTVKLMCLSKRLHEAVSLHLRLLRSVDFTENKICGWMPLAFTDQTLTRFLQRCPELNYIYGLHPWGIAKRRQRGQDLLTIPGVIEALSACPNLKGIETCDIFLLEAVLTYIPKLEILRAFRNRDGDFPILSYNRIEMTRNPYLTTLHLTGVVLPQLPRMDRIKHIHLKWVQLTDAHPFRDFSVPMLRTFVMNNCAGPLNALKYVPLITGLAAARSLARLELVRVPFLGGLIQHVVEDSWRMGGFRQLSKILIGACKHALEADLGYLILTCASRLSELLIQPSLTKDSFFASITMAGIQFPVFTTLHLGFTDDFPEYGKWSNEELVAHGLADVTESPAMITDIGMRAVIQAFPNIRVLTIYNCPHLHYPSYWLTQGSWAHLRELHLRRCHALRFPDLCRMIPLLVSLESLYLEQMFREPPKGCSRVGLSAGTGLGVSSALVQNTGNDGANQDVANNNQPANQHADNNQPPLEAAANVVAAQQQANQDAEDEEEDMEEEVDDLDLDLVVPAANQEAVADAANQEEPNNQNVAPANEEEQPNNQNVAPANEEEKPNNQNGAAANEEESNNQNAAPANEEEPNNQNGAPANEEESNNQHGTPAIKEEPNNQNGAAANKELCHLLLDENDKGGSRTDGDDEVPRSKIPNKEHAQKVNDNSENSNDSMPLPSTSKACEQIEKNNSLNSENTNSKGEENSSSQKKVEKTGPGELPCDGGVCDTRSSDTHSDSHKEGNVSTSMAASVDCPTNCDNSVSQESSPVMHQTSVPVRRSKRLRLSAEGVPADGSSAGDGSYSGKGKSLWGRKKGIVKKSKATAEDDDKDEDDDNSGSRHVNQSCQATSEEIRETTKKAKENEEKAKKSNKQIAQGDIPPATAKGDKSASASPQKSEAASSKNSQGHTSSQTQQGNQRNTRAKRSSTRGSQSARRRRKPNMCDQATSTSDPVIEDDHVQLLSVQSNSLISLTIREVGITDLVLQECPKLQTLTGSACRVLKNVLIRHAAKLTRVSFAQCRKLRNADLMDEICLQPAEKNRLIFLRPVLNYDPVAMEKYVLSSYSYQYHTCLIHDYHSNPEESMHNHTRVANWADLLTSINYDLLKQQNFKDLTKKRTRHYKRTYPWNRNIYRMQGKDWDLASDLPWLRTLSQAPDMPVGKLGPHDEKPGLYNPRVKGHTCTNASRLCTGLLADDVAEAKESDTGIHLYSAIVYVHMCDLGSTLTPDKYI